MTRKQMIEQRKRNLPIRWFGPCAPVDPRILARLKRGRWQGMIPVNPYLSVKARLGLMLQKKREG